MRGLEFFIHHVNRDVRLSRHAHSIIRTKFKRNSSSVFGRNVTKRNLLGSTPKKKICYRHGIDEVDTVALSDRFSFRVDGILPD
jgi:hypothetical protein